MAGRERISIVVSNSTTRANLKSVIEQHTNFEFVCFEPQHVRPASIFETEAMFLDEARGDFDPCELVRELRQKDSPIAVTIVAESASMHPDAVIECFRLGVSGFVTDTTNTAEILAKLNAALSDNAERVAFLRRTSKARAVVNRLSVRQREVLELTVLGLQNKQIAARLGLSTRTVEKHRTRLYQSTGVYNVIELARLHSDATCEVAGQPFHDCCCVQNLSEV